MMVLQHALLFAVLFISFQLIPQFFVSSGSSTSVLCLPVFRFPKACLVLYLLWFPIRRLVHFMSFLPTVFKLFRFILFMASVFEKVVDLTEVTLVTTALGCPLRD